MSKKTFPREVIENAVRMVRDPHGPYKSEWAAIESIAKEVGCAAESLRRWVRKAERNGDAKPIPTTNEQVRIQELEREVRELRQLNETLRLVSTVLASAELDRR